ncbi:MAG: hypothetical protein NXH75_18235 [Halobacteriovoraceae bacterium]|nr:hypothetical protein [Halobacteriovoraceae bacterium]
MKSKVLVVSIHFFSPEYLDGVNKIIYNLLKENPYYDADFVSLHNGELKKDEKVIFQEVKIKSLGIQEHEVSRKRKIIPWIFGQMSLLEIDPKVAKKVSDYLISVSGEYDSILFAHLSLGQCLRYLPREIIQKSVLLAVDSYNLYMTRRSKKETNLIKKALFKWEVIQSKKYEKTVYELAPHSVFVSSYDEKHSREVFPRGNFNNIYLGVDTQFFTNKPNLQTKNNQNIFTGKFG